MPFTAAELNAQADFQAGRITHVSLHTASPAGTGANETTGSGYARQAITFPAATSGSSVGAQLTFLVPAGSHTHFGYWTAATGGTFRGGFALDVAQNPGAGNQVKLTPTLGPFTSV